MKPVKKPASPLAYVAAAYLAFWIMVLVLCGGASMVFHAPPLVMRWLSDLCAWSPTIVLFLMLPRLRPGVTAGQFLRESFSGRVRPGLLAACVGGILGIFFLSVGLCALWTGETSFSLGAYPVWLSVVLSLLSGPTGEECGWRGYLRPELEKRFGFLRGALLGGVIWAFWHAVLWVVDNDFTAGWELVVYILANVIVMTALNLIMAAVLERENNLFYAVVIHLCFNLPYSFLTPDIRFYVVLSVLYALAAGAVLALRRHERKGTSAPA